MCGTSQSKYSYLQCIIDVAVRIRSRPDDGDVTYLLVVVNSGVYVKVISATLPLHCVPAGIRNRKQTQQYNAAGGAEPTAYTTDPNRTCSCIL